MIRDWAKQHNLIANLTSTSKSKVKFGEQGHISETQH